MVACLTHQYNKKNEINWYLKSMYYNKVAFHVIHKYKCYTKLLATTPYSAACFADYDFYNEFYCGLFGYRDQGCRCFSGIMLAAKLTSVSGDGDESSVSNRWRRLPKLPVKNDKGNFLACCFSRIIPEKHLQPWNYSVRTAYNWVVEKVIIRHFATSSMNHWQNRYIQNKAPNKGSKDCNFV